MSTLFVRAATVLNASFILVGLLAGCESNQNGLVPVSGSVTWNGKPLSVPLEGKPSSSGTVTFVPESRSGTSSTGKIDSSGNFRMSTYEENDGVPPGSYKVVVSVQELGADNRRGDVELPVYLTPAKYRDATQSGLTARVELGKALTINFDLK